MFNEFFLPISIVMGLVVYGFAAKWYVAPALARLDRTSVLAPILLFHGTRYIGLAFLIPGVTAEPLDPRFADPAAYGDLLAAILALVALLALRSNWPVAIPLVWIAHWQPGGRRIRRPRRGRWAILSGGPRRDIAIGSTPPVYLALIPDPFSFGRGSQKISNMNV